MPFIFLLLFALICLQSSWPAPPEWLTAEGCAILVGTMIVTSWLLAELLVLAITWLMVRNPGQRQALMRRYAFWRRYHFVGLLTMYLASLYLLGWGAVLANFWKTWVLGSFHVYSETVAPGVEIGLLAPFFAALFLSWERFYYVEKTAYELGHDDDRFIPKRTYLLLQIRHQMLLVMPPIFLLVVQQILYAIFPSLNEESYLPVVLMLLLMAAAFVAMPLLLRIFLGLQPLPPGPLRDRLEQTARRLHFGYSNVLVWNTRNLFANALVTGFIPWVRYVVLTDRLIDELTPEEIEAVFGHEIGHIKHYHLFFYLAFFLSSFVLLGLVWESIKDVLRPHLQDDARELLKTISSFGKLGLLAVYTLFVFGFFSRRCERQADLFGSHAVSTDAFINALEKVASINGIPRDRAGSWLVSWQHPTIAQRIEFLESMRDHPDRIPQFQHALFVLKCTYFVVLSGLLLWLFDAQRIFSLIKEF